MPFESRYSMIKVKILHVANHNIKSKMKKIGLKYLIIFITLFTLSCEKSENITNEINNQITVSIADFIVSIDENPSVGLSLGTIEATTNRGSLTFSIIQQTPSNAVEINSSTGEVTVLTESLFDYETHPIITGIVKINNEAISATANITIILNDVDETTDEFKLLAVSNLGEVFEIGNNTGNIETIGQINRENSNSILSSVTLVASENKIYVIEYIYNPSPTNNLLIFDRENGTTQRVLLTLPSTISGDERGIIALDWDNNNLIGVLAENVLTNNSTKHIISINLQDNSITDFGITFNEDKITSMKKINSKIYLSTFEEGFLEVDLNNSTVNNWSSISGTRMAQINNTELAIMQFASNGIKPGIINLTDQSVSDSSNGEAYGLITIYGSSIYENQVYFNLVSSTDLNLYLGILKTNFQTYENTIVEINSTSVDRNLIILDTTN